MVCHKCGKALSDYAGAFDALSLVPVIGSGVAAILKTLAQAKGAELMECADLDMTRRILEDALIQAEKKIIIVIDDIDRLANSQIRDVFYLWKCFDKDGVEAYLKGLLKTEVNKLKFICAMATKWHSTNGSGWRFYPQNYSEYISQNEVYNMIQGFDKSKLNQFTDIEQIKLASFALNYNKNEMDHADEQAALNLISEWKTGKAE